MPFTPPPQIPNFDFGNGSRIAVDRYDFEAHLEGTNPPYANNFRHSADQIDLLPRNANHQPTGMLIDGYTVFNVQQALQLLANIVSPPNIQPATTVRLGIVQLVGDISGTATNVVVTKIQGKPISSLVPSPGQVLTWNGTSWSPSSSGNATVFSGDLQGASAGPQQVLGITGVGSHPNLNASIHADGLVWDFSVTNPNIMQATSVLNGANMNIGAQSSSGGNGGNIIISGGSGFDSGNGSVLLQDGSGTQGVQVVSTANGRWISLAFPTQTSSTQMPFNTGDLVVLVGNAAVTPTAPSPAGPIMYGSNGKLWVMQSDGVNFPVGSIPNPSIWGTLATNQGETLTYRDFAISSPGIPVYAPHTFALPDNTATRVDVILIGKTNNTNESAQYNLSIGYVRNAGGGPAAVGTLTSADPRVSGSLVMTTGPTITTGVNSVLIQTGAAAAVAMHWTIITQLIFAQF
jgi:hypothetical protein